MRSADRGSGTQIRSLVIDNCPDIKQFIILGLFFFIGFEAVSLPLPLPNLSHLIKDSCC